MKRFLIAVAALLSIAGCRTTEEESDSKNIPLPVDPDAGIPEGGTPGGVNDTESIGSLRHKEFEVRFTNPICQVYKYGTTQNVVSVSGQPLSQKPKDVFCTRTDSPISSARPESPQFKLVEWINHPDTKEIFFAYLSFSNKTVQDEVCKAIKERNVKVTFVLDDTTDLVRANELLACEPANGDPAFKPKLLRRGHTPGIGFAHNKMFLINPNAGDIRLVVSSGNMSSGVVLHHENWLFVQPFRDTYFAEAHLCLMKGQIDHYQTKAKYQSFIKTCKSQITFPEETDIRSFFVPGEGDAATKVIEENTAEAEDIRLAAHRFSYNKLIAALKTKLGSTAPATVRMVFDDDTYWAGKGTPTGDNTASEYKNATFLESRGAKARWMETNHSAHLLHHNKFIIFNMPQGSAKKSGVFTGAGNLTGTAFSSNFENFYYIDNAKIVEAYNKQYDHLWNDLATDTPNMPAKDSLPPGI